MADQNFNVNCGFFNSVNQDRLYNANEMNKPYRRIVSNGVFATPQGTPSTDLQVLSRSSGMNIGVLKGEGIFGDKWFENPNQITITVPNNETVLPRRDSVIAQVDERENGRVGRIVYRTGEPSSNPMPPDINILDNVTEYRIANIYVASGATAINQDAIVDLRGSSECPWVTHLLYQVDTSTLFEQFNAAYWNWYDTTREAWDEFMRQIHDDLSVSTNIMTAESHYITTQNGQTVIPINITGFDKYRDVLMVRINGLFASEVTDYTISSDSTTITLTKDINANNNIDFIMLKSVVVGDVESLITMVNNLTTTVSALNSETGWINFTLESGATAYDADTTPACRKNGNRTYLRGAIKNVTATGTTFATLPTSMKPAMKHQFTSCVFSGSTISGTVVLEVSTNGTIKLIAKSGTISNTACIPISTNFIVG